MKFKIIEKVVQYIEENYHNDIKNGIIENVTGYSEEYVRNVFNIIVNISLDEYMISRQLALVIQDIIESNKNIRNSNLLPWDNENSFSKAFIDKYDIQPIIIINNNQQDMLQQKIDISELKQSYNKDIKIVESLVCKFGGKKEALLYVLSLKPYILDSMDWAYVSSGINIEEILIRRKYSQYTGDINFTGEVPYNFYCKHSHLLYTFYDTKVGNKLLEQRKFNNVFNSKKKFNKRYIVVKKSLKRILLDEIGWEIIINDCTCPPDFVTFWYDIMKTEKFKNNMFYFPNEMLDDKLDISFMNLYVLMCFIMQEQGQKHFNTMEDLKNYIKYDSDKPKIYKDCIKCNYINSCKADDSLCLYYENLSDNEKDVYDGRKNYEILTLDGLYKQIRELITMGLLYFNFFE